MKKDKEKAKEDSIDEDKKTEDIIEGGEEEVKKYLPPRVKTFAGLEVEYGGKRTLEKNYA